MHARPLMDWMHGSGPSRTGTFSGTTATVVNIGAAGSPLTGPQFGGNCSIGGIVLHRHQFPEHLPEHVFLRGSGQRLDQEPDVRCEQPADRRARLCHRPPGRGAHGREPDHREAVLRALLRRVVQGRLCRVRESAADGGRVGEHDVRAEPARRAVHRQRLLGSGSAPAQLPVDFQRRVADRPEHGGQSGAHLHGARGRAHPLRRDAQGDRQRGGDEHEDADHFPEQQPADRGHHQPGGRVAVSAHRGHGVHLDGECVGRRARERAAGVPMADDPAPQQPRASESGRHRTRPRRR